MKDYPGFERMRGTINAEKYYGIHSLMMCKTLNGHMFFV